MRIRAGLGSTLSEIVTGFRLAGWPVRALPDRLEGITIGAVVSRGIAHAAGEQAVRLGAQELRPAGADPPRRRPEARPAQHGRDRGGRDSDPELDQLALDAHVAPARVLARQPRDQAARLGRKWRTTRPTAATSASRAQRPVPAVKRLRANRKQDKRSSGSRRLAAASRARSTVVYRGRFPPRPRIASWWRKTTISSSLSPPPRTSTRTSQHRMRYSTHVDTKPSLNGSGRDHQHSRSGESSFFTPQVARA